MKFLIIFLSFCFLSCKYIETPEDQERFHYFNTHKSQEMGKTPNKLHFIWLGSAPFPKDSRKRLQIWIDKHPMWECILWVDQKPESLDKRLTIKKITKDDFSFMWDEFLSSDNPAERSALLRLEILYRQGGVVIDHDVVCKGALDHYNQRHDFYTELKPIKESILSSSVQIAPHLIASKPSHPLVKQIIDVTKNSWDTISQSFHERDPESILYRVLYHTQVPIDDVLFENLGESDAVLTALPIEHLEEQLWLLDPDAFLKKVRNHLLRVEKNLNWTLGLIIFMLILSVLGMARSWKVKT